MLVYIIFFLLILTFLYLGEKKIIKGVNFYSTTFFIIFLFSALRFDVGYDYMYYYDLLTKEIKYYEAMFERIEFFNKLIINLSQALEFLQLYFIITSFLIIILTYKTIKKYSKDFLVSTLIFLSFPIFFLNSLSIIRQYVAISIIFYSYNYIRNRKLFHFLVLIFLAFLFHKSAIIGVVLYWLYNRNIKNVVFLILYVVGLFSSDIAFYTVKWILPQYIHYLEEEIGSGGDKLLIIFQIIGFLLLFFVNKKKESQKNFNFYMTSFFIGLFIWSSLAPYGHAGFRGGLYFLIFFILLLPEIFIIAKQRKVLRKITIMTCFAFFIISLILGIKNPNKDPNIPYRIYFLTDTKEFKN